MSANLPPSNSASNDKMQFVIAEYVALKDEIMKRSEFRYQLISVTIIIAGTILTFGLQSTSPSSILFTFPILGCFLASAWAHNVIMPRYMGAFIRDHIESQFDGFGWDSAYKRERYSLPFLLGIIATSGIFLGTEIITLVLGLLKSTFTAIDIVLIVFDVIAILVTLVVLRSTTLEPRTK